MKKFITFMIVLVLCAVGYILYSIKSLEDSDAALYPLVSYEQLADGELDRSNVSLVVRAKEDYRSSSNGKGYDTVYRLSFLEDGDRWTNPFSTYWFLADGVYEKASANLKETIANGNPFIIRVYVTESSLKSTVEVKEAVLAQRNENGQYVPVSSLSLTKVCTHDYKTVSNKKATCIGQGELKKECRKCGDIMVEVSDPSPSYHKPTEYTVVKSATLTEMGEVSTVCATCGETYTEYRSSLGSTRDNPYITSSSDLWQYVKTNGSKDLLYKTIQVTGTVKSVSAYSDLTGYYLEGTKGQGLVCWVNGSTQTIEKGTKVTFQGQVQVDNGTESLEITNCEVIE